MSRLGAIVVGLLAVGTALTACGSTDHRTDPGSSASTTVIPATTTPDAPEAAILNAYQEFWQVWLRANDPPDPDYPDLAKVATGQELETVRQSIAKKRADGTSIQVPGQAHYRHAANLVGILDGVATVADCALDDAQEIRTATGELVNGDVVTQTITAALITLNDRWLVLRVVITKETPGEVACTESQ